MRKEIDGVTPADFEKKSQTKSLERITLKSEQAYMDRLADRLGMDFDDIEGYPGINIPDSPAYAAEELWAFLRQAEDLRRQIQGELEEEKRKQILSDARDALAMCKSYISRADVVAAFQEGFNRHIREKEDLNGSYRNYRANRSEYAALSHQFEEVSTKLFHERKSPNITDRKKKDFFEKQLESLDNELQQTFEKSPKLAAQIQYEKLVGYSKELNSDQRFAWTPSRLAIKKRLLDAALTGQASMMVGESGTGKTTILESLAKTTTGQSARVVEGGQEVRILDLIAKPAIKEGSSGYDLMGLGEAAVEGLVFSIDEFGRLPAGTQTEVMSLIDKLVRNAGSEVTLPVINQRIQVSLDFLFVAMTNPETGRYDRETMPPEVRRKFKNILEVGYLPNTPDNPELYEVMVATLIDRNGRIAGIPPKDLAPHYTWEEETIETERDGVPVKETRSKRIFTEKENINGVDRVAGGALWRFAGLIDQLNKSYSHQETILKHKAEGQYLQKTVIDLGAVTAWLKEYTYSNKERTLQDHLCRKLTEQYLTAGMGSKAEKLDRELIAEFMRSFGIVPEEKLETQSMDILSERDIGLLSPRLKNYYTITDSEPITQYFEMEIEGELVPVIRQAFTHEGVTYTPGEVIERDGKRYQFHGLEQDTGDPIFELYKETTNRNTETTTYPELPTPFEQAKVRWKALYQKYNIDSSSLDALTLTPEAIATYEKLGKELDFNHILMIPAGISAQDLLDNQDFMSYSGSLEDNQNTGSNGLTWMHDDIKNSTKYLSAPTTNPQILILNTTVKPDTLNKTYLQVVAKEQALSKQTGEAIKGLDLIQALILDREHFDHTQEHLFRWANNSAIWLTRTKDQLVTGDCARLNWNSHSAYRRWSLLLWLSGNGNDGIGASFCVVE